MQTEISLEIRGTQYPVELSKAGIFSATTGADKVVDTTLEGLQKQMLRLTRQTAKLSIRVSRPDYASGTIQAGTITGIHAVNRAILVRWDNGQRDQIAAYSCDGIMTELTPEETEEYESLVRAEAVAHQNTTEFRNRHVFDAFNVAKAASDAATKGSTDEA